MHFMGWAYPLEAYARALGQSGLLIEAIREPVPSEELSDRLPGYQRWRRVPLFLHMRARKDLRTPSTRGDGDEAPGDDI
jgi:hypothetical protein